MHGQCYNLPSTKDYSVGGFGPIEIEVIEEKIKKTIIIRDAHKNMKWKGLNEKCLANSSLQSSDKNSMKGYLLE